MLVNGAPTKEFAIYRGIRQGDPLSSYLFLFVGEVLNQLIKRDVSLNKWKRLEVRNNGMVLSHLQFADDSISVLPK